MYQSGEIELNISIQEETVWLTQKQIVELFDSSKANISEHIKSICDSNELNRSTTVRKFRTVQNERFWQKMVCFFSDECSKFRDNGEVVYVGCCASQHHEFGYNLCNDIFKEGETKCSTVLIVKPK